MHMDEIYLLAGTAWKIDINHRNINSLLCVSNTLARRCGKNGKQQTRTHTHIGKCLKWSSAADATAAAVAAAVTNAAIILHFVCVLVIIFLHVFLFLRTAR